MIKATEYYNNPAFNYADVKDEVNRFIDEMIDKYAEVKIDLNADFESGQIVRYSKKQIGISLRYLPNIIKECKDAGLSYNLTGTSADMMRKSAIIIYVPYEFN